MKRSFIFLLGLLCIIMVEAKNHYFKHLGVSDGLSQVCIFSIYQDELGAVWLGTSELAGDFAERFICHLKKLSKAMEVTEP